MGGEEKLAELSALRGALLQQAFTYPAGELKPMLNEHAPGKLERHEDGQRQGSQKANGGENSDGDSLDLIREGLDGFLGGGAILILVQLSRRVRCALRSFRDEARCSGLDSGRGQEGDEEQTAGAREERRCLGGNLHHDMMLIVAKDNVNT